MNIYVFICTHAHTYREMNTTCLVCKMLLLCIWSRLIFWYWLINWFIPFPVSLPWDHFFYSQHYLVVWSSCVGLSPVNPLLAVSPVYGFVLIQIILERDKKWVQESIQRDKREWKDDVTILQSQNSMLKSVACFWPCIGM